MNKIYDNGALMLGNVQDLIVEVERQKRENIDMLYVDMDEILKELKELRDIDYNMIVCINYENDWYMGYTLYYWRENDSIPAKIIK